VNVLWLNSRIMFPLDQGGRIRTYHTLKHLSRRHHIAVVTLAVLPGEATSIPAMSRVCRELHVVSTRAPAKRGSLRFGLELGGNLLSRRPYSVTRYRSRVMRRKVKELLRRGLSTGPVDLVVCDFLPPAVNLPALGGVPLVLFAHNVEAVIWDRLAERQTGRVRRAYFRLQAARVRRFEDELVRRCALVIAVSDTDRDTFHRDYGIDHVAAVPTGVDTAYFGQVASALPPGKPQPGTAAPRRSGPELVFVGSMDWMPNEDAAVFLIEEVLPRVRRSVPGSRLTIVGKSPSARLRRLGAEAGGVAVTGRVDDVRPYLERARVVVVPLRVGGGTRIKIFEAMAARRPVVATTIGAEGLPVAHGREVLIADGADDFAEAAVQVLTDDRLADRLAEAGRQLVEERFDWTHAAAAFAVLLERVGKSEPGKNRR